MRVFNADGSPRTDEISLLNWEGEDFGAFRITGLSNGNFLVTSIGSTYPSGSYETSSGFGGRIYSPNGNMKGVPLAMGRDNLPDRATLTDVSVEALETGGFITLLTSSAVKGLQRTAVIQAEIYDDGGRAVVSNFEIASTSGDWKWVGLGDVQVSANENGSFVVTWRENFLDGDRKDTRLVGKVFNPDGTAASENFTISEPTVPHIGTNFHNNDVIWGTADQFVVTSTLVYPSGGEVYAQVFNTDGTPVTDSIHVTGGEDSYVSRSSIALLNDGRFIISWRGLDDDSVGIKAKIFGDTGEAVDLPYTTEDSIATIEISDLLSNDTGFDGDSFVFSLDESVSANGADLSYDVGTGMITYDPTAAADIQALNTGDVLEDTFVYTITDENGATSEATVTLVVGGLDEILT